MLVLCGCIVSLWGVIWVIHSAHSKLIVILCMLIHDCLSSILSLCFGYHCSIHFDFIVVLIDWISQIVILGQKKSITSVFALGMRIEYHHCL